jgi:DNA-directed RNA polymerase specialized sigma24 family protein
MADSSEKQRSWVANLKKLTVVAINLFKQRQFFDSARGEPVMKGLGKSPMDFASDAATEFYTNPLKYRFKNDGQAFAVMVTILKNDFIDACRKHSFSKSTEVSDEDLPDLASHHRQDDPSKQFDAEDLAKKFLVYARGDKKLIEVIEATAILAVEQGEVPKRDDIAKFLGIDPGEVTKRTDRLRYNFDTADEHPQTTEARTNQ